jgi:hypothetical protein
LEKTASDADDVISEIGCEDSPVELVDYAEEEELGIGDYDLADEGDDSDLDSDPPFPIHLFNELPTDPLAHFSPFPSALPLLMEYYPGELLRQ